MSGFVAISAVENSATNEAKEGSINKSINSVIFNSTILKHKIITVELPVKINKRYLVCKVLFQVFLNFLILNRSLLFEFAGLVYTIKESTPLYITL